MKGCPLKILDFRGCRIEVILGDLTEESTEGVVNPANQNLFHGGGVAGALVAVGGAEIQRESDRVRETLPGGFLPVGESVVTGAGSLPCRYIIHTVGPRWGEGDEEEKLRRAVFNALLRAEERSMRSVSLPAVSTGVFGFPKERGVEVILHSVKAFLAESPRGIEKIRFVNKDSFTAELFSQKIQSIYEEV